MFIAVSIRLFNLSDVTFDSVNLPTVVFFPTKIQPSESSAVFPGCIRIPSNYGTFNSNGSLRLNFGEYVIYRYRDCLYLYSADYLKNQEINIKNFSFKTTLDDLDIYFGNCIDYIGLGKAKKIFQKLGIPPWQRKDYPLVFQQGKLIAIIGLWVK